MSIKLLNHRLSSLSVSIIRSVTVLSDFDLGKQMKIFNDNKEFQKTLELFNKYKKNNVQRVSGFIITQTLKACAHLKDLQYGLMVNQLMSPYLKNDPYVLASSIHLYMQCGDVKHAQLLFDTTKKRSLSIYGAMMKGFINNNLANRALDLFKEIKDPDQVILILLFNACAQLGTSEALTSIKKVSKEMPKSFQLNIRVISSLFDALIKCGDCSSAEILFSKMRKSVISYGNLMNGFNLENNPWKTLDLFYQMKNDNIQENLIIYLCLIKALSQIGIYAIIQSIIDQIPKTFLLDDRIANALIDMWGKTGSIDRAKQIFENISQPDRVGYTAMINSYGLNGMGMDAIELYRQMPAEMIDEFAHVCVLNACSHSGLVEEATSIFQNIQIKTGRIFTTMIDCLSRASLFERAQMLIDEFELDHSPIWPMYMALLSGARNEKNVQLSEKVYCRMKTLFSHLNEPLISGAVLLANTCASSGEIEKASNIQSQLNTLNGKKQIGLSWTSINGQIFRFRAHDRSHPRSNEIYAELQKISQELISHGHQYDSSWITRSLDENETISSVLCGHSEKLAIAWNFVENPNTSRIQVTKNLRVCGDCHRATKLIAAIRQCEIIVRDANRIHHFHINGQCSCNDYF